MLKKLLLPVFLLLPSSISFAYYGGAYTVGNNQISHAVMAENAVNLVLKSDKASLAEQKLLPYLYYIKAGAEMPDNDESDPEILGIGTNAGHFYDWQTGENWLGERDHTAKTELLKHVYKAKRCNFINHISRAIHYVEDSCEPHHATNKVPPFSYHVQFESFVNDLHLYSPDTVRAKSFDKTLKTEQIIDICSRRASIFGMDFTKDPSSYDEEEWLQIARSIVPFTESMVASFLYSILN